jgi:hypothetical protein
MGGYAERHHLFAALQKDRSGAFTLINAVFTYFQAVFSPNHA